MSAISATNIPISTTAPTVAPSLKTYFEERKPEILELNKALKAGDLAGAERAYNDLVALGKNVLHKDNPFLRSDRGLDFNAIGGALQNGDLAGAQQAFAALESTFGQKLPPSASAATAPSGSPAAIVQLSNGTNAVG